MNKHINTYNSTHAHIRVEYDQIDNSTIGKDLLKWLL